MCETLWGPAKAFSSSGVHSLLPACTHDSLQVCGVPCFRCVNSVDAGGAHGVDDCSSAMVMLYEQRQILCVRRSLFAEVTAGLLGHWVALLAAVLAAGVDNILALAGE